LVNIKNLEKYLEKYREPNNIEAHWLELKSAEAFLKMFYVQQKKK